MATRRRIEQRDLLWWVLLSAAGLALTALAVRYGARLGTASAPFLGSYRIQVTTLSLLAPAVAVFVLIAGRGFLVRARWNHVLAFSYVAGLAWAFALALADGRSGLTRSLSTPESFTAAGHPPGPGLLLDWLHAAGITHNLTLGIVLTTFGLLTVPLVLTAVRSSGGDAAARAYAPVLILAPYAVWTAVSLDAVVAVLGAAGVMLGERGSKETRTGWHSGALALASGVLLGFAALFSYSVPWLGLSVICLYFARRRPLLHLATGAGALLPILLAVPAGFNWFDGLLRAGDDFEVNVEPHRSALWWSGISVVALLLAAGPPLIASARKLRNTPGWPFLVGGAVAILFSVLAGFARGGVEHAWLPFFPWLLIAATAPEKGSLEPVPAPLMLVSVGAVTAIVIEAVLATPW